MTGLSARPLLSVEDVSVRFGGVRALDGVTLAFPAGEACGLIGSNGAGKTTLFDVLSGIRPPTTGVVRLGDHDVTRRPAAWRARHGLRRTFQRQQTFGWLSVADNVLVALESRGGGGGLVADLVGAPGRRRRQRRRAARVDEVLALCGLADVANVPAASLPVGAARMVELARAVVDPPEVLLLDEATSGLDVVESARLGDVVRRVREAHGCTVVLIEHDVAFVMAHAERVIALHLGRVLADDTPAGIQANPAVREAYLG